MNAVATNAVPALGVVIVDDDPLGRQRVRDLLAARRDVNVAAECANPSEAVAAIASLRPDILFLDVEMPRGSGLSVLEAFDDDVRPATVLVTAHEQYAIRAFALQAVDYLLKPFEPSRFDRSLERARAYVIARSVARARLTQTRRPVAERFAVRTNGAVSFVRAVDVDWIETAGNYVRLHLGREAHLVRETMSSIEEHLDPRRFVRTHRSSLVNVDRIRGLVPSIGREYLIVLRDGTQVKLGPQYRENLRRAGFDF